LSIFVEVFFQQDVGGFIDIEAGHGREANPLYLLHIKAGRAFYKILDAGSAQLIGFRF
jgi:hypothetical protein